MSRSNEMSVPQLEILVLLALLNGYIVTNEGAGYRVWIEDASCKKVNYIIRKDTVNILHQKGCIEFVEKDSPYFYYKLTVRTSSLVKKLLEINSKVAMLVKLRLKSKGWIQ